MYYYSLTRVLDDAENFSTTFTVSDRDPINCAHMLAAVFNTVNRNFMNGWLLGSVNTHGDGSVEFDGKVHQFAKPDPHTVSTSFKFKGSASGDSLITFFGENDATTYTVRGDVKLAEKSKYAHVNRDVLESAYAELQAVKEALYIAGAETITADVGVKDLSEALRARDGQIAELVQQRANQNAAARDELIEFTRGSYEKLRKVDPEGIREDLQNRYQGMLDVLANLLVAIGEADRDERHAVARRLVETED